MAKFNFLGFEDFWDDDEDLHHEFINHCEKKPKLNLGSNVDIRPGFVNVDILDIPGLDLICDITHLDLYMPKNTFTEILCYDLLEHFPFAETTKLLSQWVSWLASDGKIIVRTPDMERLAHALIDKTIPTFEIQRLIYGGQDYEFNFHKAGFSGDMLEGLLRGAGCSEIIQVVREPDTFNVTIVARK